MRTSMAQRSVRWRANVEAKQRSKRSVGWVTKIYYARLLRASEGTTANAAETNGLTCLPKRGGGHQ
jgi:hypothetical protein